MNPTSTFALRQLAQTHLAARDTSAAIAAFERALRINPNDAQSRRALDALRRGN
jgi:Flp pilus assembly protein TadD